MQQLAHVIIDGERVLVLLRATKHGVALKFRESGAPGPLLTDESAHLADCPDKAAALLRGDVVYA